MSNSVTSEIPGVCLGEGIYVSVIFIVTLLDRAKLTKLGRGQHAIDYMYI